MPLLLPIPTLFPYTTLFRSVLLVPLRQDQGADPGPVSRKHFLLDPTQDRKSTRLNSSHPSISYAVFCLKIKNPILPSLLVRLVFLLRFHLLRISLAILSRCT